MVKRIEIEFQGAEILDLLMQKARPPVTNVPLGRLREEVTVTLFLVDGRVIEGVDVDVIEVSYSEDV